MTAGKKSIVARVLRIVGFTTIALIVLAAVAYVFRGPLFGKIAAEKLAAVLSTELGGRITIDSVEGDVVHELILVGVRFASPDPPIERLEIARARISFPFLGLLGEDVTRRIREIQVSGLDLALDLTKAAAPRGRGEALRLPLDLPEISIAGRVSVTTTEGTFRSNQVALDGSGRTFKLVLDPLELPAEWGEPPTRVEAHLERPDADTLAWSSASTVGGVGLKALRLKTRSDGAVEAGYDLALAGGTVSGSIDAATIRFAITDVDVGRIPRWIRARIPAVVGLPATGIWSSTGTLRSWNAPPAFLEAEISARGVVWEGMVVDRVTALIDSSGPRVAVRTMRAEMGGTAIVAEGVVLDGDDPLVLVSAEAARIEGKDAAAFATALGIGLGDEVRRFLAGVAFSVRAERREGDPIRLTQVGLENADVAIEGSATIEPRGRWAEWRDFPITASLKTRSRAPQARTVERVEARVEEWTLAAEVRGSLGRPSGSFEIDAKSLLVAGERIDRAIAAGTLDWPRVAVTRLDATAPDGALKAAGTLDLETREVRQATFDLALARTAILQRLIPDLRGIEGRLEARGTIERAGLDGAEAAATIAAHDVRARDLALERLDATLQFRGRELRVESARAVAPWGEADLTGTVTLDDDGAALDLEIDARAADIGRLAGLWDGFGRAKGSARARGRLTKTARAPRASWAGSLESDGLVIDEWKIGDARADTLLEWPRLDLAGIEARGEAGRASGSARLDLATGAVLSAAFDLDAQVDAGAIGLGAGAPVLRGLVRVEGRVEKREGSGWNAYGGDARLSADVLEIEGREIRAFRARVASAGAGFRVEDLAGRTGEIEFAASGTIAPEEGGARVDLEALTAALDADRALALARPTTVRWRPGSLVIEQFEMAGLGGRIAGHASLGERAELELEARALELGVVIPKARGVVDAELSASGSPDAPTFTARVHAPDLSWGERRVSIEASFRQADGVLAVEALDIDAGDLLKLEGRGRLPAVSLVGGRLAFAAPDTAAFTLHGTTSGAATWAELGLRKPSRLSDLELDVDAKGRELLVQATAQLLVRRARDDRDPKEVPVAVDALFSPRGARMEFKAGSAGDPLATAVLESGLAYDWTNLGVWLAGDRAFPVEGRLDVEADDAAAFEPFFPELRHLGGQVKIHAEVRGTAARPEFTGTAALDGGSIRFEADVPGIDDLVARLRLEGREVVIEKLEGKSGYSPFTVTGRARIETTLRSPVLDVAVDGTNFLIARDDDLRLRADLKTTLKGRLDALKVAGQVSVTDALWSQPMDLVGGTSGGAPPGAGHGDHLFRFRNAPLSTATLDLTVTADKTIRVDNNLVQAVLSAQLSLVGNGEAPRLEGRIVTERAYVRLPFTRLDIERAEIQFRPQDDYRPRLDAVAWTRIKGYELTVHVGGVLPETQVKVASLPPVSQRDAYLLLTTGITPAELEREGVTRAALNRAGSVYGTELLSQFSRARDQNPLERFSLEIGRDQSERGNPTVDMEAPLSEKFFLHVERDRFDDYDAGIIWRLRLK